MRAPRVRFTLRIAGSSSGLSPTASAIAKRSVSIGGPSLECVRGEDHDDQDQHDARQQVAEVPDAAIELGFGRPEHESTGDGTELGGGTGACDETPGCAATHVGSEKHTVGPLGHRGTGVDHAGLLLDGKALAGQYGFTEEEVGRLDDEGVSRHQTACGQQHQIARDDARRLDGQ